MQTLRVALAQTTADITDPVRNLEVVTSHLADVQANVLVFPELHDIGYDITALEDLDLDALSAYRAGVAAATAGSDKTIVTGCTARTGNRLENQAVAFAGGEETACYTKAHIYDNAPSYAERPFTRGDSLVTVEVGDWRFGLAICYDLRFPSLFAGYRRRGVDGIILISAWPLERSEHWTTLLRARAIENQYFVLAAGCVGNPYGTVFAGNTLAFDPWGNSLGAADSFSESRVEVTLDKDLLRRYRAYHDIGGHERQQFT